MRCKICGKLMLFPVTSGVGLELRTIPIALTFCVKIDKQDESVCDSCIIAIMEEAILVLREAETD